MDLKAIPNLHFLGFRVYAAEGDIHLPWIVRGLEEGFVPKTLEKLTIIVRVDPYDGYTIPPGLADISWSFGESGLDSALVSESGEQNYPNLHTVEIVVEVPMPGDHDVDTFFDFLGRRLPRLTSKALLDAQLCRKDEVQATMCTLLPKH